MYKLYHGKARVNIMVIPHECLALSYVLPAQNSEDARIALEHKVTEGFELYFKGRSRVYINSCLPEAIRNLAVEEVSVEGFKINVEHLEKKVEDSREPMPRIKFNT